MGPPCPSVTTLPFWVISMMPWAASWRAASRVSSMSGRQRVGKAARGASEGQQVAPGWRRRSRSRIVRCSVASSACTRAQAGEGGMGEGLSRLRFRGVSKHELGELADCMQ